MRLKHIKNADNIVLDSSYSISNPKEYKGKWNSVFKSNNDIHIEIGTGRGKFIIQKAIENKDINYIGIEKYSSALVKAVKKLDSININNLKLIIFDAINIEEIFDKEIDTLYLNFSDPWPKKRHTKRRLTSSVFLDKYDKIFKDTKKIEMKTDNKDLFEYSTESLINHGYDVIKIDSDYKDNITTEYEDKFIKEGIKINYIKVEK